MFYTYILYSKNIDKFYVGYSSNLEERICKHNNKHKGFTNQTQDWEIVFSKAFQTKIEAQSCEKKIKSWKSRKMIESLISQK